MEEEHPSPKKLKISKMTSEEFRSIFMAYQNESDDKKQEKEKVMRKRELKNARQQESMGKRKQENKKGEEQESKRTSTKTKNDNKLSK